METQVIALLERFGFPILLCVWFMWRMEQRLDRFSDMVVKMYLIFVIIAKANGLDLSGVDLEFKSKK